jgi:sigma-E factor negative regulatory protein RseC
MEQATGHVVALETGSAPLRAEVEVIAEVACARCASGRGCGAGLLGANEKNRRVHALIAAGVDIHEGDEVRIELSSQQLLRASWLVYGLPLVAAVIATGVAYLLGLDDFYAVVAAVFGGAAGLVLARRQLSSASCLHRFTPTIIARLPVPD